MPILSVVSIELNKLVLVPVAKPSNPYSDLSVEQSELIQYLLNFGIDADEMTRDDPSRKWSVAIHGQSPVLRALAIPTDKVNATDQKCFNLAYVKQAVAITEKKCSVHDEKYVKAVYEGLFNELVGAIQALHQVIRTKYTKESKEILDELEIALKIISTIKPDDVFNTPKHLLLLSAVNNAIITEREKKTIGESKMLFSRTSLLAPKYEDLLKRYTYAEYVPAHSFIRRWEKSSELLDYYNKHIAPLVANVRFVPLSRASAVAGSK